MACTSGHRTFCSQRHIWSCRDVQVYKGVLRGVQEVAVKQLRHAGGTDLEKFLDVSVDTVSVISTSDMQLQYLISQISAPGQWPRSDVASDAWSC